MSYHIQIFCFVAPPWFAPKKDYYACRIKEVIGLFGMKLIWKYYPTTFRGGKQKLGPNKLVKFPLILHGNYTLF